jgi:hypothetical protein
MDTSIIDLNTKLIAVYYNKGKPPHMFKVWNDFMLFRLKDQLNQINHKDTSRVDDVEYRRPLTDSTGIVQFTEMKLRNDDDVRTMFSIFGQYITKCVGCFIG